jgi:hypothetical protein
MTVLMQEVMDRVQTLPDNKLEALLTILSGGNDEPTLAGNVAYVEDDLTDEERAIVAAGDKAYEERPENYIPFSELMKRNGITEERLAEIPPFKIVYNLKNR